MRWGSRRDADHLHGTFACGAALVVERQGQQLFDREAKATIRVLEALRQQVGRAGYCDINVFEDLRIVRDAVDNLTDRVARTCAESVVPKVYRAFHSRGADRGHRRRDRLPQAHAFHSDDMSYSGGRGELSGMAQAPWHDLIRPVADVGVEELCDSVVDLGAVLNGEDLNNKAPGSPLQKSRPCRSPHRAPKRPMTTPSPALRPNMSPAPVPPASRTPQPTAAAEESLLWEHPSNSAVSPGARAESAAFPAAHEAWPLEAAVGDFERPASGQGLLAKLNQATPTPPPRPPSRANDGSRKVRPARAAPAASRVPVAGRGGAAEQQSQTMNDAEREADATLAYVRRLLLRGGAALRRRAEGRRSPSRIAPGRALA